MSQCANNECFAYFGTICTPPEADEDDGAADDLEVVCAFLETVPLFRKQLPKADILHVAGAVVKREFHPGDIIVEQGELRQEFCLIMRGLASVEVDGEVHAVLEKGDYWGDGMLVRQRPSAATIRAKLPDAVIRKQKLRQSMVINRARSVIGKGAPPPPTIVALILDRAAFERIGLHNKVKFPKRLAIYNGFTKGQSKPWRSKKKQTLDGTESPSRQTSNSNPNGQASTSRQTSVEAITDQDEDFIVESLKRNVHLRPILQVSDQDLKALVARKADIIFFEPGEDIVKDGEYSQAFYIIKSGSVEVVPTSRERLQERMGQKLAQQEAALQQELLDVAHFRGHTIEDESNETKIPGSAPQRKDRPRSHSISEKDLNAFGRCKSLPVQGRRVLRSRNNKTIANLGPGSCVGELSLVFNTKRVATFRAAGPEATVLYVIDREDFKRCFYKNGPEYQRTCDLLDDVPMLNSLFRFQRWELARNASGFENFSANEVVIQQGKVREARMWYIISSGSAFMSRHGSDHEVELYRGDTFGERSLLLGTAAAEVSVRAGREGMVGLCIQGEVLQRLGLSTTDLHAITGSAVGEYMQDRESLAKTRHDGLIMASSFCVEPDKLRTTAFLGRGAFGFVVLQEDDTTGDTYALKRMSKGLIQDREAEKHVSKERDLMSLLNSQFVVRLHITWRDEQFLYMLEDAMLGGSLDDLLRERLDVFTQENPAGSTAMFYVACVVEALSYLHDLKIVYRDLKPENVLLDRTGYVKVCDMGFARFILGKTQTFCGTPDYVAPEIVEYAKRTKGYTFAVDWWSLGAMTFELLAGHSPFDVLLDREGDIDWQALTAQHNNVRAAILRDLPERIPTAASKFVEMLMQVDPRNRLGTGGSDEVRNHEWFQKANFDFAALRQRAVEVPYVPPAFVPKCAAPDLWDKHGKPVEAVLTEHCGKRLCDGGDKLAKQMTIDLAKMMCKTVATREASEGAVECCEGFTCQPPAVKDAKVKVWLKSHWKLEDADGWTSYRCHTDLFERWTEYRRECLDWDKTFELPVAVLEARSTRQHVLEGISRAREEMFEGVADSGDSRCDRKKGRFDTEPMLPGGARPRRKSVF